MITLISNFSNDLPSMDEALITNACLFPKICPTHDEILVQEETINTCFNNLPPRDEALRNHVDPSHKQFLPHKDTLVQEDALMLQGFYILDNPLYEDFPSIQSKINRIYEEVKMIGNPLYEAWNVSNALSPRDEILVEKDPNYEKPKFVVHLGQDVPQPPNKLEIVFKGG